MSSASEEPVMNVEVDETPTLPPFDWLVEVAIPAAVFGLLGCFIYYLIDLRAALGGEAGSALRWVCFWFLLASVLIVRIRTKYGDAVIAVPYLVGLFAAMFFFIYAFTYMAGTLVNMASPSSATAALLFNFGLVMLIWWLASIVTRECTAEDAAGQEERPSLWATLTGRDVRPATGNGSRLAGALAGTPVQHNPQRMLLYLSAVVLAVVALGQRVIGDKGAFSAHAYWCMGGYLFFAFVLLALTNLSSLRIEARRRRLQVARHLTPTWITATTVLVIAILAISAFIPRVRGDERHYQPAHAPSWIRQAPTGGLSQGPAAGLSQPPQGETRDPNNLTGKPTDKSPKAQQTEEGKSGTGGETPVSVSGSRSPQVGAIGPDGKPQRAGESRTTAEGDKGQGKGAQADKTGQTQAGSGAAAQQEAQSSSAGAGTQQPKPDTTGEADKSPNERSQQEAGGDKGQKETPIGGNVNWLLWLLLLLLLAAITYLIIRHREAVKQFLAQVWQAFKAPFLTLWAALVRLWERLMALFGRVPRQAEDPGEAPLPANPFEDIFQNRYLLESLSPSQMATHVYRAFMAFCDLRGCGRREDQTEREFLRAIPERIGVERTDREGITAMYLRARYSPSSVGPDVVPTLQDFWSRLRPAIDTALGKS